jgi:hypothetical protein
MPFAKRFLGLPGPDGFTLDMLQSFLSRSVEEGLNLDYKHIKAVDDPDKIAKSITAFANSGGGLVLLGVEELEETDERGRTVKLKPGPITWGPKSLTREKLESMLIVRIHPPVQGLRIHPIRSKSEEVVFLIDVPQSMRPPHQAPDKRYYLRYNFQNLPMDHYQVADLFLKRLRPDLRPSLEILEVRRGGAEIVMRIGLVNEGSALAKWPIFFAEIQNCAEIKEREAAFFLRIDSESNGETRKFTVYSSSPLRVVHPRMISYEGILEITLDAPLVASITVGAEEMPTKRFLSMASPGFLSKAAEEAKDRRFSLVVVSPEEEFDQEMYERLLHQVGIDPGILAEFVRDVAAASTPEDIRDVFEEFGRKLERTQG